MSPVVLAMLVVTPMASLHMTVPRPVMREVAAYPQIAVPADDAQRRINAAVARLDARVRLAARDCVTESMARTGEWKRTVTVTMRGPRFVSYLVDDYVDCGGAHPDEGHSAIVYDLMTGAPVDWTQLLPATLTGKLDLVDGADQVKVVTLASLRLFAMYRAGYRHDSGDAAEDKDCRDAISGAGESGPPPMLAWLDAKTGGLAVQFDLPHAAQACSEPVVIPVAVLRREGASSQLVTALTAAHATAGRSGQ